MRRGAERGWRRWLPEPLFFLLLLAAWQLVYTAGWLSPLLFPSLTQIGAALLAGLGDGSLLRATGYSLRLIALGMGLSLLLALLLTLLSMLWRPVKRICRSLIAVLDPLPGLALLPLAILWFGLGNRATVFVMLHSILWPMLLNALSGFDSVPAIYDEVGRSIGLRGLPLLAQVYVPASIPSLLAGVKTGWSRAWRALISAEMVFGAVGGSGGLGWQIYTSKVYLDMPAMFATLLIIMAIGVLVEKALFSTIERLTVKKWGMSA